MDRRLTGLDLKTSISAIADLVMPRVCVVCGTPLIPQEKHICLECLADMPLTRFSSSLHNAMADKFNALVEDSAYCRAAALYYYGEESGYRRISQSLKYKRNFAAGRYFAGMLGDELAGSELFKDVDLVVPVPLHWTRRWKRGYNQAEIIAGEIAGRLDAPMCRELLSRRRRTKTQTAVSVDEKKINVYGAFKTDLRALRAFGDVRHILLVDDVFTTGCTLAECHRVLREALGGDVRISVATLGFVGR